MMDTVFFWISKLGWKLCSPDSVLVMLSGVILVSLWTRAYKRATRLMTLLVVLILTIAVFPVGDFLLSPLEKRFPSPGHLPDKVDGIILLGGAERVHQSFLWQQVELNKSSERFFAFIRLIKKYPHARHAFTSGSGDIAFQEYKGAQVAEKLFREQGMDTSKMIFESHSRNTYENAVFTRRIIAPKPGENWILITSAAHMPRSVGIFSKINWRVIPYPVDHETRPENLFHIQWNFSGNLIKLNDALQEWTGLIAYYATGKTTRLFPGPLDLK
jgi:uncharacterized SAM-binding protein YcdF (DUF218 family)